MAEEQQSASEGEKKGIGADFHSNARKYVWSAIAFLLGVSGFAFVRQWTFSPHPLLLIGAVAAFIAALLAILMLDSPEPTHQREQVRLGERIRCHWKESRGDYYRGVVALLCFGGLVASFWGLVVHSNTMFGLLFFVACLVFCLVVTEYAHPGFITGRVTDSLQRSKERAEQGRRQKEEQAVPQSAEKEKEKEEAGKTEEKK